MEKELIPLPENATVPEIVRHEIAAGRADAQSAAQMLELQISWERSSRGRIQVWVLDST